MTLCVNPECRSLHNSDTAKICSSCGSQLLLRMHYRPIRVLGKGTFGQTFLAVDEDIPSKPHCAVKLFHFSSQHPEVLDKAIELFKQEANRLDSLGTHPQIPALLACFQQEQRLYLVQEFIEGLTLEQELQQGVYNEAQIWQLLRDLLPVLQFIHQNKVFHRDIKPQNIIRRERDGKLVLIDFGAAKLVSETHLKPGTLIGTQGYAPPELIEHGKVDRTSDLYSLGVTCVRMLTEIPTLIDMYDSENYSWHWREYLPPRTSISAELSKILDKLLQISVKHRYQSAEEVLQALLPFFVKTQPPINHMHQEDGFVYWLMGERAGRTTVNVWNWLWGMSEQS